MTDNSVMGLLRGRVLMVSHLVMDPVFSGSCKEDLMSLIHFSSAAGERFQVAPDRNIGLPIDQDFKQQDYAAETAISILLSM